jgi:hypothetical protein
MAQSFSQDIFSVGEARFSISPSPWAEVDVSTTLVVFKMPSLFRSPAKKPNISWPIESKRPLNNGEWEPASLTSSSSSHIEKRYYLSEREDSHVQGWEELADEVRSSGQRRGTISSEDGSQTVYCSHGTDDDPCMESDEIPDEDMLQAAAELPILDEKGNVRSFKSLYSGSLAIGRQNLIIFVRHFFCGVRGSFPRL